MEEDYALSGELAAEPNKPKLQRIFETLRKYNTFKAVTAETEAEDRKLTPKIFKAVAWAGAIVSASMIGGGLLAKHEGQGPKPPLVQQPNESNAHFLVRARLSDR